MGMLFSKHKAKAMSPGEEEVVVALGEYPVFTGLPEDRIPTLAATMAVKTFKEEEIVCHCPDATHDAFVVLKGVVALSRHRGDEEHVLDLSDLGAVFNVAALVGDEKEAGTARALGAVELLHIDSHKLHDLMERDPALGYPLVRNLCRLLLAQFNRQLERLLA
ncbi:MAG: Crp/Fnr family transcriptional regulator [Chloroflexi bacterium]|nr:Crp/Fnr family transcriptional regulator [Chloroflexota bacterium]